MRVLISAGELSGSMHAAMLVTAWREQLSSNDSGDGKTIEFYGMGGRAMAAAGVRLLINSETELSVMGVGQIINHLGRFWRAWHRMVAALADKPDWLLLVDYGGFNLRLAKQAKRQGIRVCYFIPPKVWAWGKHRLRQLARYVDRIAVILPFEVAYYAQHGLTAYYVGNPSWQRLAAAGLLGDQRVDFDRNNSGDCTHNQSCIKKIALLPGSRHQEVDILLPIMLQAASALQVRLANLDSAALPPYQLQFYLMRAASIPMFHVQPLVKSIGLQITIISNADWSIVKECQAAVVASGTATLEVALLGVPMVVVYRLPPWEFWLAKQLVHVPYVSLCNIVAGAPVAKELLQQDFNPTNLVEELMKLLNIKTADHCSDAITKFGSNYLMQQQLGYQRIVTAFSQCQQHQISKLCQLKDNCTNKSRKAGSKKPTLG